MNITYLLGAGASANAIPTVENMPQAINNTIGTLKQFNTHNVIQEEGIVKKLVQGAETHTEELKPILEDLEWLYHQSLKHASIDTAAKKFFILDDKNSLRKLKKSISLFFLFQQII